MSNKKECHQRLTNLYNESHEWLLKASYNITGNIDDSADLVSELYLFLGDKCNPKIFWGSSYNLLYLHQFLKHRWLNKSKRDSKVTAFSSLTNESKFSWIPDEEYDIETDIKLMETYDKVMDELKRLETTHLWPKSRIFSMYFMSDDTLNELGKKIGISTSTVFISIKQIRQHLSKKIDNPFNKKQ